MNIDIVNKRVSNKLNINEKKVAQINKFYWRSVYDHFYSYNPQPVNIDYVCVLYPDKWLLKKAIKRYIQKIRATIVSKRFKPVSGVREYYIEYYKGILIKLLKVRKHHKYTN